MSEQEQEPVTAAAPEPAAPAPAAAPPAVEPAETHDHHGGALTSVQSLGVTVVIAVFVITFLVQAFQIPSESMEDTLLIGDYLLVDKVHYGQGWGGILPYQPIRRGDIIVFRYPVHPTQHFVKRVVGLPGDRVRLVHKRLVVNGKPLEERYAIHRARSRDFFRDEFPAPGHAGGNVEANWWLQMRGLVDGRELLVPQGQYFVLGDNRDESLDSRYWGFVPRENIIGRPLLIYWSVRSPIEEDGAAPPDGKLARFVYVLTHIPQFTRWDRTLRIIE